MKSEDFEKYLENGVESQDLDYKESCTWDVIKFAKDILAMSNIYNGGFIIIGMNETSNGYIKVGVVDEVLQTYDNDVMKDQMSSYADPWVNFKVHIHIDKENKKFVFIRVFEFDEIPIICKKDSKDTRLNTIYFRNRNRRWESAPISNTSDLRDLLERAAVKLMKKMHKLGLSVGIEQSITKKLFDEEIKDLI